MMKLTYTDFASVTLVVVLCINHFDVIMLKDLSGVFVVLLLGCGLSLFVFLIEQIHFHGVMNRSPTINRIKKAF